MLLVTSRRDFLILPCLCYSFPDRNVKGYFTVFTLFKPCFLFLLMTPLFILSKLWGSVSPERTQNSDTLCFDLSAFHGNVWYGNFPAVYWRCVPFSEYNSDTSERVFETIGLFFPPWSDASKKDNIFNGICSQTMFWFCDPHCSFMTLRHLHKKGPQGTSLGIDGS